MASAMMRRRSPDDSLSSWPGAVSAFKLIEYSRYERVKRFPAGLLVTGDALCSFNPAYAQGMSVSALEARVLRDTLNRAHTRREEPDGKRFFRAAAKVVDRPWMIAAGGDLAFPGVEGKRSAATTMVNGYLNRLLAAAERDAALAMAFVRVAALLDPPPALMRPDRLLRVFVLAPFRRRRDVTLRRWSRKTWRLFAGRLWRLVG